MSDSVMGAGARENGTAYPEKGMVTNMKKIIAVLLMLSCALMLFACAPTDGSKPEKADLSLFTKAIETVSPRSSNIKTKLTSELGELNGSFTVTYSGDKRATIAYEVEEFNEIGESSYENFEIKSTKTGTITYEDGKYSTSDGVTGEFVLANELSLNLDPEKMTYSFADGNTTLKATVLAANTEAVLGTRIGADVTMTLKRNDITLTSITLTYVTTAGTVEIVCDYNS